MHRQIFFVVRRREFHSLRAKMQSLKMCSMDFGALLHKGQEALMFNPLVIRIDLTGILL